MQKFIDSTIKPFFIIGGIGTAAAGMNAFFPRFAVENLQKLEFVQEYTIFVQHWGRYCQLKSNWPDFLPRARNLNAEQSMSYEFVYCLIFGQIHLT